jgi:hypothetical protein
MPNTLRFRTQPERLKSWGQSVNREFSTALLQHLVQRSMLNGGFQKQMNCFLQGFARFIGRSSTAGDIERHRVRDKV